MNKLKREGNKYFIERKKSFQIGNRFKDKTIDDVFEFAYAMIYPTPKVS